MRGKQMPQHIQPQKRRITPADAGKTGPSFQASLSSQDHPRGCGENCVDCCVRCSRIGSPPRMRGKQLNRLTIKRRDGITPADAGKTSSLFLPPQLRQDHPRRCGENFGVDGYNEFALGSPPQVRGKLNNITSCYIKVKDHPRRCGENISSMVSPNDRTGSPPQVRGKLNKIRCECVAQRITPAGAGKTYTFNVRAAVFKDHPRRCGENFQVLEWFSFYVGSPPQVRGKQVNSEKGDCTLWITPAGAGKTHSFCRKPRCCRDHPRRCGENLKKLSWAMTGLGSPPQVRGKRIKLSGKKLRMRITPAGAGKTTFIPYLPFLK